MPRSLSSAPSSMVIVLAMACGRIGYDLLPEVQLDAGTGGSGGLDGDLISGGTGAAALGSGGVGAPDASVGGSSGDAATPDASLGGSGGLAGAGGSATGGGAQLDGGLDASQGGTSGSGGVGGGGAGGVGGTACTPESMISASWYHSNFDEGPGLWQPAADATPTGYLDGDENEWGGVFDQYLSRTTGNCDRAISIYRSAQSSMAYWELTLTNDTGLEIIGLVIRYDLELEWSRFQGTDSLGADYGIRSERFAWYLGGVPGVLATSPYLSTPTVDAALMQRWLSDAEMDAAGLAVRGVSHQVTGLSLAPGVAFTLRFGMEVTGTTNQNKNVNLGIDNLEIDPVHP